MGSLDILNASAVGGVPGILETGGTSFETSSVSSATSRTISIVAAGTANTKGSWQELIPSTTDEAQGFIVNINFYNSNDKFMLDIGIGGAGNEDAIIDNIYSRQTNTNGGGVQAAFFPINIPAGTRISARVQGRTAGTLVDAQVIMVKSTAVTTITSATTLNADTSVTDTGNQVSTNIVAANTKSAYQEITASLAKDITSLYIIFAEFNSTVTDATFLYDIAIGDAGSEVILIGDLASSRDADEDFDSRLIGPIPVKIASGTRIVFRFQCNVSSATCTANLQLIGI